MTFPRAGMHTPSDDGYCGDGAINNYHYEHPTARPACSPFVSQQAQQHQHKDTINHLPSTCSSYNAPIYTQSCWEPSMTTSIMDLSMGASPFPVSADSFFLQQNYNGLSQMQDLNLSSPIQSSLWDDPRMYQLDQHGMQTFPPVTPSLTVSANDCPLYMSTPSRNRPQYPPRLTIPSHTNSAYPQAQQYIPYPTPPSEHGTYSPAKRQRSNDTVISPAERYKGKAKSQSPLIPSGPRNELPKPRSASHPPTLSNASPGRAVVIGIDYFNQKGELHGSTRRAENFCWLLRERGYREHDIHRLSDSLNAENAQPTKNNILKALKWLVKDVKPGEKLLLFYTGHGRSSGEQMLAKATGKTSPKLGRGVSVSSIKKQQDDASADETIYPVDFRESGVGAICPGTLHEILLPAKAKGARITLILEPVAGIRTPKGKRKGCEH